MRNLENVLSKRQIDYAKLIQYGFKKELNVYKYKTRILDGSFSVEIEISDENKKSKVIDMENEEEYSLVDVESTVGEFVGKVRNEYENVINEFIMVCTKKEVFKSEQAKEVILYIRAKYGDELEFLWEKFDDNAIWRNKKNNKWYGLLMNITENKLKLNSNKKIEVINLMCGKDEIQDVVDNKGIFPGYHMNKKSWISVKLDNTLDINKIYDLIDKSYELSISGNKKESGNENLAKKVYEYLTTIPRGKVVTYKQVAEFFGNKGLARAVGNILHKNPDEKKYPCYKVVNSKGELSGAFAFGGAEIQKQRLEKEGIEVLENKVDLDIYQWKE